MWQTASTSEPGSSINIRWRYEASLIILHQVIEHPTKGGQMQATTNPNPNPVNPSNPNPNTPFLGCFILHLLSQKNFIIRPSVPLGEPTNLCDLFRNPIIFRPPPTATNPTVLFWAEFAKKCPFICPHLSDSCKKFHFT